MSEIINGASEWVLPGIDTPGGKAGLSAGQKGRPIGRPKGRPIGRPKGWPIGRPEGRPIAKGRPIGRPIGQPLGRILGRPIGRPIGQPVVQPSGIIYSNAKGINLFKIGSGKIPLTQSPIQVSVHKRHS